MCNADKFGKALLQEVKTEKIWNYYEEYCYELHLDSHIHFKFCIYSFQSLCENVGKSLVDTLRLTLNFYFSVVDEQIIVQ